MATSKKQKKRKKQKLNFQYILLPLIALLFVSIVFKLAFWDKRVRVNTERENDASLSFETESLDSIMPLDASNPAQKEKDTDLRILFLGNGSLAENMDSDDNMANIIKNKTGATVYNCAIPDTYMSMKNTTYEGSFPYDAFSFYYLCSLFTIDNTKTSDWAKRDLGGSLPPEVQKSLALLQSIDYDKLDVLCVYYDAADYLEQRPPISKAEKEEEATNPSTFCGALSAGVELVQKYLPHVRIIVMSPTYAYVVDKDGNYTSSFLSDILKEPLSLYVGLQAQTCMKYTISFVDNFYGSIYEEIADDYLKDHILLNPKGNALVADRFLYALNRFHEYDF